MKKILAIGLALTLLWGLAGCKTEKQTVTTDGSTSMEKVIGAMTEAYMAQNSGVTVTYNPTGSGSGIAAVTEGRCDIGLSSRALTDEEKARGLTETLLAYDGIAIVVHPENPVSDLSLEDLAKIFTGQITDWSALGGSGQIVCVGREAGSGTRDGFEAATGTEERCVYRQELTSTGDVLTTVGQNSQAIGYVSLASVGQSVKVVSVNGVAPSEETVLSGDYPVQRPFVLVTRTDTPLSPAAQDFFAYATGDEGASVISSAGAVPAHQ